MTIDLVVLAAEPSADYKGAKLIEALPDQRIAAVAGPLMRKLPVEVLLPMEEFQVMGFTDVLGALPRLVRHFFFLRNKILELNPKAVVCIDYPGFHLRLQNHLRKKGFQGKLIQYACPTVWAWGKKRIPLMAKNLDLLLCLFPFEKECFIQTSLPVAYIGHPLTTDIPSKKIPRGKILALFPGSRKKEIERNLPLQLHAAKELLRHDPKIDVAISCVHEDLVRAIVKDFPCRLVQQEHSRALMQRAHLAIAKSGTVTLELALHATPTVVNFAISPLDVFLAQKIFKISLPYYCIVNIIAKKEVFPEFFGPRLTKEALATASLNLWIDEEKRKRCVEECSKVRSALSPGNASQDAARLIVENLVFGYPLEKSEKKHES